MRVMIMAGGTGGHIYPGLAVAEVLRSEGHQVQWLGTRSGMESRIVPQHDLAFNGIDVAGLRGNGVLGWLKAPWRILRAVYQSNAFFAAYRPDVILGMGGFASGPGGIAAALRRIPLVIHEQNARPGLTNRVLKRVAAATLQAFEDSFAGVEGIQTVGNPVRAELFFSGDAGERVRGHKGPMRLLVLGGSQGARVLNQTVPEALAQIDPKSRPEVLHQAGRRDVANCKARYQELAVEAQVVEFIEDMASAYQWADMAVCRSGALTVSELASAGLGALLVPLPHAVDDHQTENAKNLERLGGGKILRQSDLSARGLAELLMEYGRDREALARMASSSQQLARPESAREIASMLSLKASEKGCVYDQ